MKTCHISYISHSPLSISPQITGLATSVFVVGSALGEMFVPGACGVLMDSRYGPLSPHDHAPRMRCPQPLASSSCHRASAPRGNDTRSGASPVRGGNSSSRGGADDDAVARQGGQEGAGGGG